MPRSPGYRAPTLTPGTCLVDLADEALAQFRSRGYEVDPDMLEMAHLLAEWFEKRFGICVHSTLPEVLTIRRRHHRKLPTNEADGPLPDTSG